jgi:hypothetical protein
MHDAAFDEGYLTINDGYRIHADALQLKRAPGCPEARPSIKNWYEGVSCFKQWMPVERFELYCYVPFCQMALRADLCTSLLFRKKYDSKVDSKTAY